MDQIKKMLTERASEVERLIEKPYCRNLILKSFSEDEKIYRIEKFDHLKGNLFSDTLHFTHPGFWETEDPLDSIFLKKDLIFPDGDLVYQGYYDVTFCQSWSKNPLRELWEKRGRDLAPDYANIMMVSTIDKVMMSFEKPKEFKGYSDKYWCVEVEYFDFSDINDPIILPDESAVAAWCNARAIADAYKYKRTQFAYENELRFIANLCTADKGKNHTKVKPLLPVKDILIGVIFDPRMSAQKSAEVKAFLKTYNIPVIV